MRRDTSVVNVKVASKRSFNEIASDAIADRQSRLYLHDQKMVGMILCDEYIIRMM